MEWILIEQLLLSVFRLRRKFDDQKDGEKEFERERKEIASLEAIHIGRER